MEEITTVRIVRDDSPLGFELVNEHDFNPEIMQLLEEPKPPPADLKPPADKDKK